MSLILESERGSVGPYVPTSFSTISLFDYLCDQVKNRRYDYLSILTKPSTSENLWFPTLDIDDGSKIDRIEEQLKIDGFPYVVVKSSPLNYWILIDNLKPFDEAFAVMSTFTWCCDSRYLDICKKNKIIRIRAFIRNLFKPEINIKDTYYSTVFKNFIQDLHDHFNSKTISFLGVLHFLQNNDNKEVMKDIFETEQKTLQWKQDNRELVWESL